MTILKQFESLNKEELLFLAHLLKEAECAYTEATVFVNDNIDNSDVDFTEKDVLEFEKNVKMIKTIAHKLTKINDIL